MDVHADTIVVAVAEGRNPVRSLGVLANRPEAVRRLVKKLGDPKTLRVCYEAGPTGYLLYWPLTRLGVACEVVARLLIPKNHAGDRIKTDRRDAEKLARLHGSGDLTSIWVPDGAHEAPPHMQVVVKALQSMRGIAQLTAVTITTVPACIRRLNAYLLGWLGYDCHETRRAGREVRHRVEHRQRVLRGAPW